VYAGLVIERLFALYRGSSSILAVAALVAANLVPLAGVLLWGWDLATILVLYWVENGIVGLFTVPKILLAAGAGRLLGRTQSTSAAAIGALQKAGLVPFFAFHYGMFWVVHGVFVFAIAGGLFAPAFSGTFDGPQPDLVLLGGLGLLASHGVSFGLNYLARGEYRTATPAGQMVAPYARVIVLHVTIIVGAIAVGIVGAPVAALAVLVMAKTVVDLGAHLAERARAAGRVATTEAAQA
jgi:hypothetical protein